MPQWASLCINLDLNFCVLRLDFWKDLSIVSLILFLVFFANAFFFSQIYKWWNSSGLETWPVLLTLYICLQTSLLFSRFWMPSTCSDARIYISNPTLSSKFQTDTSKYLLVTSTCVSYIISSRKYPKRIPHRPSFCSPTTLPSSLLPISRGITFLLLTRTRKPSGTSLCLSPPHLVSHQGLLILPLKYTFNVSISLRLPNPS